MVRRAALIPRFFCSSATVCRRWAKISGRRAKARPSQLAPPSARRNKTVRQAAARSSVWAESTISGTSSDACVCTKRVEHCAVRLVHRVAGEIAEPVVVLQSRLDLTLSGPAAARLGMSRTRSGSRRASHPSRQAPGSSARDRQHPVAAAAAAPAVLPASQRAKRQLPGLKHAQKFRSPRPELQRVPRARRTSRRGFQMRAGHRDTPAPRPSSRASGSIPAAAIGKSAAGENAESAQPSCAGCAGRV